MQPEAYAILESSLRKKNIKQSILANFTKIFDPVNKRVGKVPLQGLRKRSMERPRSFSFITFTVNSLLSKTYYCGNF